MIEHSMNCGHYDPEIGCTCSLRERQRIAELEGQVQKLLKELAESHLALRAILIQKDGCRFCDFGVLRTLNNPAKGHDFDCGFHMAEQIIGREAIQSDDKNESRQAD